MTDRYYTDLIDRARLYAERCHAGQTRRYTGEPYIEHCREVAELVASVTPLHEYPTICAAWLHDVVEDCEVRLRQIDEAFGPQVAHLVYWLTDADAETGNRAQRKAADRARLSRAPPAAQTIKLADLISNTATIAERDPGFARTYLAEKAALLEVLTRGHTTLKAKARETLEQALAKIGAAA